jgi:hypothetical protein
MVVRCNSFSHFGPTSAYVLEVVFLKKKNEFIQVRTRSGRYWTVSGTVMAGGIGCFGH